MAQRWPEIEYVDLRSEGQVVAMPAAPAPAVGGEGKPGPRTPGTRPQGQGTGDGTGRVKAGGGHA